MAQLTIETRQLGMLKLNRAAECYETVIDTPFEHPIRFSIDDSEVDTGLPRLERFAEWFKVNHQAFKNSLEYQIQNHDLVWDDVWDEILGDDWVDQPAGFLADYLIYKSVDYSGGKLYLWVDTSGLHTDHVVRATLNENMEIERCEML